MAEMKKCRNRGCEWNNGEGGCRLFPGDFGFLECRHCDDETEKKKNAKKAKPKRR